MMQVNEDTEDNLAKFTNEYKHCLHDHTCMLAKGTSSADPYCDALRRETQKELIMKNEGHQKYVEESEVDQKTHL